MNTTTNPKPDSEPVALSALQHWLYCPRQCGLIYLEQAFDDNVYTLRGSALHEKVDQPGVETPKGLRIERALPLWNDDLGLIGKADIVEFLSNGQPYPVEYKLGSRNKLDEIALCDDLQLAGQVLCLEAMMKFPIPEAAIFYASSKRRRIVPITAELRSLVIETANNIREMLLKEILPAPVLLTKAKQRCSKCSMLERCQPEAARSNLQAARAALFDPDR